MNREKMIKKLEYVRESTSDEATEGLLTGIIRSLEGGEDVLGEGSQRRG